jgi:DNA-binding CsgD family transcriptional regulator
MDERPGEVAKQLSRVARSRVGVVEALAHICRPAKRLLEIAKTWPDGLSDEVRGSKYRTMRQLRTDEIDHLVVIYQRGATVYELAERFGISRTTVGQHLRARGIDTKPPGLHHDDIPTAAELYRAGSSLQRIAERFGTSANTVRARLLETGTTMRDTHGREQ